MNRQHAQSPIFAIFALSLALGIGCVSNPTPHPAQDATQTPDPGRNDGDPSVTAPTDQAGCDAIGGFWTDNACENYSDSADAADGADGTESVDGGDTVDGDDGADGEDAEVDPDSGPGDSRGASSPR